MITRNLGRRTTAALTTLAALLTTGLVAAPAQAAGDLVVTSTNDDGPGSLREALSLATASPEDDRITFAPSVAGTISLTTGQLETYVGAGSGNLVIEGPGSDLLTVDAGRAHRVMAVFGPREGDLAALVVAGLTLTGGVVGDGTYVDESPTQPFPTEHSDVRAGDQGGGLRVLRADVELRDVMVSGCSADQDGGGVSVAEGSLSLTDSIVRSNEVSSWTYSPSAYVPSVRAGSGGGVSATEILLRGSTIADNRAFASAGALQADSAVIEGSTLSGNVASTAAAVAADHVTFTSSTASENAGAGTAISATTVEVESSTVAHNGVPGIGSDGTVRLVSSIVASNAGGDLVGSGAATLTRSLVQDPVAFDVTDDGGSLVGHDARLARLGAQGGPTDTLVPASNSPVIDRGVAASPIDQRGGARVVGASADMGAVEVTDLERSGPPRVGSTQAPTVSGDARVGERVLADAGSWDVPDADIAFQWVRDGVAIPGATEPTYDFAPEDLQAGGLLSVEVTASAPGHLPGRRSSALIVVEPGQMQQARRPVVTGPLEVGSTLRARPRAASVTPSPESVNVRWYVGGRIAAYDSRTLDLERTDRGRRVRVVFRYNGPDSYLNFKSLVRVREGKTIR